MNRGAIPMSEKLDACRRAHAELVRRSDNRSIFIGTLKSVFGKYGEHGRTYQGYFRDRKWVMSLEPDKPAHQVRLWSVNPHAVINEMTLRAAMKSRAQHRANARTMKEINERV